MKAEDLPFDGVHRHCPKCDAVSGDAWWQCEGSCPIEGSPHYNADEDQKWTEFLRRQNDD